MLGPLKPFGHDSVDRKVTQESVVLPASVAGPETGLKTTL